jgi:molybdopterin-guanine dinucleotide biosynthesis protein
MLVVVGGHSRNIGKTSVMAGLIRALPEANWTAVKITQYGHGVCAAVGESCDCAAAPDHSYALDVETEPSDTDTGRFVAAGARQSFWLRTARGELSHALPVLRRILNSSENAIVESNSVLEYLDPDLYLVVLDFGVADFKASTRRYLNRADAVIIVGGQRTPPAWKDLAGDEWKTKPQFRVQPPDYASPELAGFVTSRASESLRADPSAEI